MEYKEVVNINVIVIDCWFFVVINFLLLRWFSIKWYVIFFLSWFFFWRFFFVFVFIFREIVFVCDISFRVVDKKLIFGLLVVRFLVDFCKCCKFCILVGKGLGISCIKEVMIKFKGFLKSCL